MKVTITSALNGYILASDDTSTEPEVFAESSICGDENDELKTVRQLLYGVMELLGKSPSRKRVHLRIDMYDGEGSFMEEV